MTEFINNSGLEFVDISSEQFRTYEWESGYTITIKKPQKLNVSKAGGHRIFDTDGLSHYISSGWRHLSWKAKDNQPNFVK